MDSDHSIIYYHNDCPTCKNYALIAVKNWCLEKDVKLDERYVAVLPKIWGEEARGIGTAMPFVYCPATERSLHITADKESNNIDELEQFLSENFPEPTTDIIKSNSK